MSFPKAVGQCPIYYNHANTGHPAEDVEDRHVAFTSNYVDCGNLPLFSFGYGLSYSKFEYRSLDIDTDTMASGDKIKVSIRLANTGSVAGREVVQLYMRDHFGTTVRPVQELIDFTSVYLEPDEEKQYVSQWTKASLLCGQEMEILILSPECFRFIQATLIICYLKRNFVLLSSI